MSTTVAGAKATSHFATLLRRSKFASYDPKIGQVYYSYDGDAARGNFGLKRPLPLRRRMAHITIGAVDSKEQQTEWDHAENEARWIKMWDEVGVYPKNGEGGPWTTRLGQSGYDADSEFAPRATEELKTASISSAFGKQSNAVPNIHAMTPAQFNVYVGRLRRARPAFKRYVQQTSDRVPPGGKNIPTNLWQLSQSDANIHEKFLKNQAHTHYTTSDSRVIEQRPSNTGGLAYVRTPLLQSMLYTKPNMGRILQPAPDGADMIAGYAGMNVFASTAGKSHTTTVDWSSLARDGEHRPNQGNAKLRYISATLRDVPNVVGSEPQGLEGLRMDGYVMDENSPVLKFMRSNPHPPGSKAYISHGDLPSASPTSANILRVQQKKEVEPQPKQVSKPANDVLKTLWTLMPQHRQ